MLQDIHDEYWILEFVGKMRGMKTLKQMIKGEEVLPASQLTKNRVAAKAQEKVFEEAVRS
jgi:hypothetical protein